jgi:hypothetical protein
MNKDVKAYHDKLPKDDSAISQRAFELHLEFNKCGDLVNIFYVKPKNFTVKEKFIFYKRMKDLEDQLPSNFLRIHHSFIINLNNTSRMKVTV